MLAGVLDDADLGHVAARALIPLGSSFPAAVEAVLTPRVASALTEPTLRAWVALKGEQAHEAVRRASHDSNASLRALAAELAPQLGRPGRRHRGAPR